MLTGLTGNAANNNGGGYMGQIADARARMTQAAAEENQAKVQLDMSEKELKELQARWKTVEREAEDGKKKLEAAKREAEGIQEQMRNCKWNQEKEDQLQKQLQDTQEEIRRLGAVRLSLQTLTVRVGSDHYFRPESKPVEE